MATQQIRTVLTGDSTSLEAAGGRGTRAIEGLVRASGNGQKSLTQLGSSSAATSRQMQLLAPQVTDVVTSLAGGQNPMLVLIQQGGQLRDVFGGIRPALAAVSSLFTVATVTAGGLAAGVGLLVKAYLDGEGQSERFRDAVSRSGNAAGITEGQFNSLIDRTAALANTTSATTRGIAEGLVASGRVGRDALEPMTVAIARVAEVSGRSTTDVTADFIAMSKGVGDWAVKYNESANFITAAQLRVVRAMEDSGNKQGAMIRVNELVIESHKRQAQQLGYLETAWRGWGQAIDWVWQKLAGAGRGANLSDQFVGQATKVREAALALAEAERNGRLVGVTAERRAALQTEQQKLQQIGARLQLEDVAARSQARQAEVGSAQIAADERAWKDRIAASNRKPRAPADDYLGQADDRMRDAREAWQERDIRAIELADERARKDAERIANDSERNRQRAIDQAQQMGDQIADQAADVNARLITDDQARASVQLQIERSTIQRRIDMLAAAGADVRNLEDDLAAYMVARRAEANEALKPQWQQMIEGWRDTNRLMRDSWNDQVIGGIREGEDAWVRFVTTGEFNIKRLGQAWLAEQARLQFRQFVGQAGVNFGGGLAGLIGSIGSIFKYSGSSTNPSAGNYTNSFDAMNVGGPRAYGGPVAPRSLHPIVEHGEPEVLNTRRGTYLLAGRDGGFVSPLRANSGGAGQAAASTIVYSPAIQVDSTSDRASVMRDVAQITAESNRQLLELLKAKGIIR